MTESQITCFLTVAKHTSFTKASELLFISQPAVSKQVSQLESELGLTLIDRTSKSIRLTSAGETLMRFFEEYRTRLDNTLVELKTAATTPTGRLRVGCLSGWSISEFYPDIQRFFIDNHPHVDLSLTAYPISGLVDALRKNEVDVALSHGKALHGKAGIKSTQFASVEELILYSKNHPVASKSSVSLLDFRDEVIFMTSKLSQSIFQKSLKLCQACGFDPKIEITSDLASIMLKIQAGEGVMLVDTWYRERFNPVYSSFGTGCTHPVSVGWSSENKLPLKDIFIKELILGYTSAGQI